MAWTTQEQRGERDITSVVICPQVPNRFKLFTLETPATNS